MTRLLLLCCLFPFALPAQTKTSFFSLSRPEKAWVLAHPFVAKKTYRLSIHARAVTDSLQQAGALDGDANGGQLDAFRHIYWMALLAGETTKRKALRLGEAHEKGNRLDHKKERLEEGAVPDSVSSVMDLRNNLIGVGLADTAGNRGDLHRIVLRLVESGGAWVVRKDTQGFPLDCAGTRLDQEKWKGVWGIPKCLVKSDRARKG